MPEHDDVHNQAQGGELVFLALPVGLSDLTFPAMEGNTGHAVPTFASIELGENSTAVVLVIHVSQKMDRFRDSSPFAYGSRK
jgi:hypothetical protein